MPAPPDTPRLTSRPTTVQEQIIGKYVVDERGCFVWTASLNDKGRPQLQVIGRRRTGSAHRMLWNEIHGPAPAGYDVHHGCENKLCVNIDHLELVPHGDHSRYHGRRRVNEPLLASSRYALHMRWHVRRGLIKEACEWCRTPSTGAANA